MQEKWVWSLVWEYPLEKEMATPFSILDWEIPLLKDFYVARLFGIKVKLPLASNTKLNNLVNLYMTQFSHLLNSNGLLNFL